MKPIQTAIASVLAAAAASAASAPAAAETRLAGDPSIHSYILLDRTGSMSSMWTEALSSVNAYAAGLGALEGGPEIDADVTLAVFDAQDGLQFDVIRENVDATDWRNVTDKDASPRGTTPLYDAIGRIVSVAETDRPEKAVLVIMTDGLENASRELTREGARAALDRAREKGWEIVFLGAEFSNFDDAEGVGQSSSRNMAVAKEQLSESMGRLAQKSRAYANGDEATIEWDAEDRAVAQEEQVKQRNGN